MNKGKKKCKTHNKLNVYIDSENVTGKNADKVWNLIKSHYGNAEKIYIYGLQNDPRPKVWRDYIKSNPSLNQKCIDKRLAGGPAKNKVDKKMIKDIECCISHNTSDTIVLISSDHGFSTIAGKARENSHRFIGIGNKESSKRLKQSCNEFYGI